MMAVHSSLSARRWAGQRLNKGSDPNLFTDVVVPDAGAAHFGLTSRSL